MKHLAQSLANGDSSVIVSSFCSYHITVGQETNRGMQKDALEHMSAFLNREPGRKVKSGEAF